MRHSFSEPERFVAGTVGEPGERAFYLQARLGQRLISVALEKSQLQAIVARLELILADLRRENPLLSIKATPRDDKPLESPVDAEFVVGAISLAWDDQLQSICLELFDANEESAEDTEDEDLLEVNLSLDLTASFLQRSKAVINAGRLPCPFCSIPIDPRGHLCPRANGYRR